MKKLLACMVCAMLLVGGAAAVETGLVAEVGLESDASLTIAAMAFDVEGVEITSPRDLEEIQGARQVRDDPGESIAYSRCETDNRNGSSDREYAERVGRYLDQRHTIKVSVSAAVAWKTPSLEAGYDLYPQFEPYFKVSAGPVTVKITSRVKNPWRNRGTQGRERD